ncbi:hypothetical protein NIIDMKKI_47380 [Mycobacterium kansasii]|uniref:Uncharacterized protein n=1 Tax=Mycobacterium kansasii TaxID=1768 RepID=A0A7G1II58_MYCKA|nr:hypothetical protein NIIDMKKI_47380 [Mycobacterium kansasii]
MGDDLGQQRVIAWTDRQPHPAVGVDPDSGAARGENTVKVPAAGRTDPAAAMVSALTLVWIAMPRAAARSPVTVVASQEIPAGNPSSP